MKFFTKKIYAVCLVLTAGLTAHSALAQRTYTLEAFRELARERNNNLKAAEQNVQAARSGKTQADADGKFTVGASVTGFYFGKPLNSVLPGYGISPGVTVNQPIYAGGKYKLGRQAAAKTIEIQNSRKALAVADVLYQTEVTYWQLISAKEQIKLAEQSKKQLAALYTDLNNQYTAGITYKNDVLRANVQQNENELTLQQAKDAYALAKLSLAQLAGLADSIDFAVSDTIVGTFDSLGVGAQGPVTFTDRPEIQILQSTLESAQIQENLYKVDLKPTVSVGISGVSAFGKEGVNPESSSHALASYYGLVSVNIPLFDWGRTAERVREQRYRIDAQRLQLKENKELISLEVRQSYLQLNQSSKRVRLAELSLFQADENLRLSKDRLKAGTIIGKDVLDAQTIWQQASSSLIEARVQFKIREADLKRALGDFK